MLENTKTKAEQEEMEREVRRKIRTEKGVIKVFGDLNQAMGSFNKVKSQVRPTMSQVSKARKKQL